MQKQSSELSRSSDGSRVGMAPAGLTRSSAGTLHGQLYRTLGDSITRGAVKPGDRMPTENELMELYGVSRTTARRALDELRREGLVDRLAGKGTFVAHPRLDAAIPHLHSVTEEIERQGYRPGSRLLAVDEGVADATVAANLGLAEGDPVLFVNRLRTADEQPFYVGCSALNVVRFPELRSADFTSISLYRLFEEVTGRMVTRAVQWLSAVGADRDIAGNLKVRLGDPVLQLERILFLAGDLPVESVRAFFHGKLYKYYSELAAPSSVRNASIGD